jgi:putative spermidine/putrescine transport system substrate-binding protein
MLQAANTAAHTVIGCFTKRRTSLYLLLGTLLLLASSAQAQADSLVFTSWGGAYQEAQTSAWLEPYSAETGVTFIQDSPTDYAQIIAMVESGFVTWDVVNIENDFGIGSSEQYFEPLDYSIIPRDEVIFADDYRVAAILYATVIGYNTEAFDDNVPQSWADFFDLENFPGTRSLPRSPSRYTLEIALIADGVPAEELYPLDVERALAKLDSIKDVAIWWDTGAQAAQHMADGEAVMGMIWNGRIQTAIDEGAPLAIQWNQHIPLADFLTVPRGAPNREQAMEFIAYAVSAAHNYRIANHISYAPSNTEAFEQVNPDIAETLPSFTGRPELAGFFVDDLWWDSNREAIIESFNAWLLN